MNGILLVDKPAGWTSHDVVDFIRKRFKIKKAGHTGTLDPIATGLLIVLVGNFTKFSSRFLKDAKEYRTILKLGITTDTQDSSGKHLRICAVPKLEASFIEGVLKRYTGEIEQIPPMVSAVSQDGVRLYRLARLGKTVARKPRKVFIDSLRMTSFDSPYISLNVVCSKGTYIRTLCEDIGNALGCGGHMSYLRRTRCGGFSVNDAVSIDRLKSFSAEQLLSYLITQLPNYENAIQTVCHNRNL